MVLIKAKRLPHDSPVPRVVRIRRRSPPSSPASAGPFIFRASEAPVSGLPSTARKKLAARLGAWAEIRACALNRSPKPSLANCLAFAADARVVSPKAVNGQLSASVEFAALQAGQRQSRKQPFVMPGTQSSLRRLRKLVCAAGHPRLAFLTHERRGWPGQARP